MIEHRLLATRRGLLSLALFALCPMADSVAQSVPTLGYAAAKNAKPNPVTIVIFVDCTPKWLVEAGVAKFATVNSTARPIGPPIWREVLINPEARPSPFLVPVSAAILIAVKPKPVPAAMINIGSSNPPM